MKTPYVYCICRIDKKYWKFINRDIKIRGYKNMEAIIPTIKILKKSFSGKRIYEEHPVLFNYGFVKIKSNLAFDRQYLDKVRRDIPGILNWVKSLETLHPKKKRLRIDNAEIWDDFSKVATIEKKDLNRFIDISKNNSIYSSSDITKVSIGSYIVLKGYPFEGIYARVDEISLSSKTATVTIYPDSGSLVLKLSWDNLFYTVYRDYDDSLIANDLDIVNLPDNSLEDFTDKI